MAVDYLNCSCGYKGYPREEDLIANSGYYNCKLYCPKCGAYAGIIHKDTYQNTGKDKNGTK